MAKKADKEKEAKFIEYFTDGSTQGNATQSCIKAGWKKDTNPAQMGAYLRKKLCTEIRERQEDRISGTTGRAITVLQDLLTSEQDSVRLNTAKLILELGNFNPQTINLNVDQIGSKTDEELMLELKSLMKDMPSVSKIISQKDMAEDLIPEKPKEEKITVN
jgi:phage terminase small subunit